jgi:hypothetical protein
MIMIMIRPAAAGGRRTLSAAAAAGARAGAGARLARAGPARAGVTVTVTSRRSHPPRPKSGPGLNTGPVAADRVAAPSLTGRLTGHGSHGHGHRVTSHGAVAPARASRLSVRAMVCNLNLSLRLRFLSGTRADSELESHSGWHSAARHFHWLSRSPRPSSATGRQCGQWHCFRVRSESTERPASEGPLSDARALRRRGPGRSRRCRETRTVRVTPNQAGRNHVTGTVTVALASSGNRDSVTCCASDLNFKLKLNHDGCHTLASESILVTSQDHASESFMIPSHLRT